jgi:hypothetical protein
MPHRLVIPSLPGGAESPAKAPGVEAITIAFGVAKSREGMPSTDDFRTTYHLQIPRFSLGGLDPDGVYEFDAGALLQTLRSRAQRRHWGVRLELTLTQAAAEVAAGEIFVSSPESAAGAMTVVGNPVGTTTPGGGRSIVVASPVVTEPDAVSQLSGAYSATVGDAEPCRVQVHLGRFEFEG